MGGKPPTFYFVHRSFLTQLENLWIGSSKPKHQHMSNSVNFHKLQDAIQTTLQSKAEKLYTKVKENVAIFKDSEYYRDP